jgi:hypothetical protein
MFGGVFLLSPHAVNTRSAANAIGNTNLLFLSAPFLIPSITSLNLSILYTYYMTSNLQGFMGTDLHEMWADGELLLASASGGFHDFSFVIFPFAKVYEGFLKKLFYQIGAISEQQYKNDRWRVGRALNPQLEKDFRHEESVYDRLVNYCAGGTELADTLWDAWKTGRNQVFHFFPGVTKKLSFLEARDIVAKIEKAMELAVMQCKVETT